MPQKNKPQSHHTEPLLYLPDFNGGHFQEHIPYKYSSINMSIRTHYIQLRRKLGLPIYYWHTRHMFPPKDRKIYDLKFITHAEKDHDGKPKDRLERWHFYFATTVYGNELNFIKHTDSMDWNLEHSKYIYLQKDQYTKAYTKKWLKNYEEDPNWKLFYHGVQYHELELMRIKLRLTTKRYRDHINRYIKKKEAEAAEATKKESK